MRLPWPRSQPRSQRGVALVAVLWVVAALSILVTGLVQTQREEIRTASSSRLRLQADALGQGAINLAVQMLRADGGGPERRERLARMSVAYGGVALQVEIQPLTGLVDLNLAPGPLLAAMFMVGGGVDAAAAQQLAASVVAAREVRPSGPPPRFQAPEELLGVANRIQSDTFRNFEIFLVLWVVYLALSYAMRFGFWVLAQIVFPRRRKLGTPL